MCERLPEAFDEEVDQNHIILEQFQFSGAVKTIKEPWKAFVATWSQHKGCLEAVASWFYSEFWWCLISPVITVYDAAKDIAGGSVRGVSCEALLNFWNLNCVEAFLENEAQDRVKKREKKEPGRVTCHCTALTIQRPSEAFGHIKSAKKMFDTDGHNYERMLKCRGASNNGCACYRKLCHEKQMEPSVPYFIKPQL